MAIIRLPVRVRDKAYEFRVELEGNFYDLSFRFNARDDHWYMDVSFDDVVQLVGVKVVHSARLLERYIYKKVGNKIPPGVMAVLDVTGADRDPDQTTFGDDVVLLYTETA